MNTNMHKIQTCTQNLYTCRSKLKEELNWIIYRVKRKDYEVFADCVKTFR